jgi:hypothetical protein
MSIYKYQELFNQSERDYLDAKQEFNKAKIEFDYMRAKHYILIKVRAISENKKPTIKDIEAELTILQNDAEHELGKVFIKFSEALAKKQRLYTSMKICEREYWDDLKLR